MRAYLRTYLALAMGLGINEITALDWAMLDPVEHIISAAEGGKKKVAVIGNNGLQSKIPRELGVVFLEKETRGFDADHIVCIGLGRYNPLVFSCVLPLCIQKMATGTFIEGKWWRTHDDWIEDVFKHKPK